MLWRELTDLEPDLLGVEAWARTLDPDQPTVMEEIKARLLPLVGWHREIPGVEIVPFNGPCPSIRDQDEYDRISGNNRRKWHFFRKLPLPARVLYTSEAWDAAVHHMTIVLRTLRRERLAESRKQDPEHTLSLEKSTMFESDFASTGIMTVGELRKRLRRLPANAEVCFHFGGYLPAAITDFEFQKPENPEEGEVGAVLLSPDPASQIGRALSGSDGE